MTAPFYNRRAFLVSAGLAGAALAQSPGQVLAAGSAALHAEALSLLAAYAD